QKFLEVKYIVSDDVWSVTSYKELRRDALNVERWNLLHPTAEQKVPYVTQCFTNDEGVIVASSDYVKTLPDSISKWLPKQIVSLGTDGFGRSEARPELRDFFEVDARYIAVGALFALAKEGKIKMTQVEKAIKELEINPEKLNPMIS
ncbi:MAG: pyruvate dehydrogenase (acetyl-transferring), homodimeric type, partial [Ignavibacteria bacterium]|nr:pyruvate dehydrogenase (acetyl-transferring), homodimeric type [Ignavibacteria bacterium]